MSSGHASPSGQLSENHCIAVIARVSVRSAPLSIADSFLLSSKTRELIVVTLMPVAAAKICARRRMSEAVTMRA